MNLVFALVVIFGITQAEDCHKTADCRHVTCPELDYILTCDKTVCSCVQTTQHTCVHKSECRNSAPGTNNHCTREFHCVDGTCRCGYGFGPAPSGRK